MPNALLEIGCEEIPARFMPEFLKDLKQKAEEKLKREQLAFTEVKTLGTYRRLTLYIEGLPAKQNDQTNDVKGPSAEIAFDPTGKPTQAAIGFAGSQKVDVASLTVRTVNNRNYVYAKVVRKGKTTSDVLKLSSRRSLPPSTSRWQCGGEISTLNLSVPSIRSSPCSGTK